MNTRSSKNKRLARKKADKYFSLWLRLSHANEMGRAQCFTCGKWFNIEDLQCGHWIRRQYEATRYNEINCKTQCIHCNTFRSGEPEKFERKLRRIYGDEMVDKIKIKSLMVCHRKQKDYEWIALKYKQKYETLKSLLNSR